MRVPSSCSPKCSAGGTSCFSDDYGSLQRGFLTSLFMLIVGIERVFHLEGMDDPGFALLTGDPRERIRV